MERIPVIVKKGKDKKMIRAPKDYKTYAAIYRWAKKINYTIGDYFVEDEKICHSLEDKTRDYNKDGDLLDAGETKIFGETAIPYTPKGYCYEARIEINTKFGRHIRFFGVPHFEGILSHTGCTPKHTLGCILAGQNNVKGELRNSRKCLDKIIDKLLTKVEVGEKFPFFIKDRGDEL